MALLLVNKTLENSTHCALYRTVQEAADAAQPGDTVVVDPGTYTESVETRTSGTATAPIKFYFRPGSLMLGDNRHKAVMNISGKSYITIHLMRSEGGRNGVNIDVDRAGNVPTNIRVDTCDISLSESSSVRCHLAKNVVVQGNKVHKTNIGGIHEMISIIGTDGFLVHGNEVFNGEWVGPDGAIAGKEGIDIKDGSRNGIVSNNYVHDLSRLGIYVDAWNEYTHTIIVRNNRVVNCKQGIALASEAGGLLENVLVEHNTLVNCVNYGIIVPRWVGDGPRKDIKILNNTLINNGIGPIGVTTDNITNLVVRGNIIANTVGFSSGLVGEVFDTLSVTENPVTLLSSV